MKKETKKYYDEEDGSLIREISLMNGRLHGLAKYYNKGKMFVIGTTLRQKGHGVMISFL